MADVRSHIVATAIGHVVAKRSGKEVWHYAEVRPIPYGKHFPLTTDCSGFVGLCFYENGAYDPHNRNYNGSGSTETLLANGHKLTRDKVVIGDVVIYHPNDNVSLQHTAIVVRVFANGDILTASMGQEGDPSLVWCGTPKGPSLGHPTDTRPVGYYRFRTATRPIVSRVISKVKKAVKG